MGWFCRFQQLEGQTFFSFPTNALRENVSLSLSAFGNLRKAPYCKPGVIALSSRLVSMTRLLSILAALALIFAPVAMLGSGHAMAETMPLAAMSVDHCGGGGNHHDQKQPHAAHDCVMTCTAIAPAPLPSASERVRALAIHHPLPRPAFHGVEPQAETPPPRFS